MRMMILGGGSCQLNLIKRAKDEGNYIVLVDYLADCPGKKYADIHVQVSTFDSQSIIFAAKQHNIEAIVTTGTDQPVLSAACAAQTLGLPFYIDSKTALAVTNKRVMKELFTQHGIPSANYRLIRSDFTAADISGLRFPLVLKPVDSQGQRGIFLVHDIEGIRSNIHKTLKFSRESVALLEEYYVSDEITVNGWADNGNVQLLSVVDRLTIKETAHIGICLCHHFPSVHLNRYHQEIELLTRKIVHAFGIQNGPLYFQYLIGNEGIKVNEIAMRIGGAYEDITIPIISGIDVLGLLLQSVQKSKCDTALLRAYELMPPKKFVSTQLYFCRPGKISRITSAAAILALPGVHAFHCAYQTGDLIPDIENATARAGYIIIEGDSFESMLKNVNYVFEELEIMDPSGCNLLIKYKDYKGKYRLNNDYEGA